MQLVYLSNGQACYLKEKIGTRYIINKIFEYDDSEYGQTEITDPDEIIVDTVFFTQPIAKISNELKELKSERKVIYEELAKMRTEKTILKNELESITKTQISQQKFIINKTELINAKTLALFPKGSVMPLTLENEDKNFRGLKIVMEIKINEKEERSWGYKLFYDQGSNYGTFLCQKYGVLINPTESEIEEIIIKRLSEFEFDDYKIAGCNDKYLSEKQKQIKNKYLSEKEEKDSLYIEKQIKELSTRLNELKNKLSPAI